MKCEHNDCFTCPYKDCISSVEVEPERKKRGRKKLPPEERQRRRRARSLEYYYNHPEKYRQNYERRTEGKVTRRYRSKLKNLAPNTD